MHFRLISLALPLLVALVACRHEEYDVSRGIDKEITLFSDQVSIPLGQIGPLTPKALMDKSKLGGSLGSFVQEDEEGYLVVSGEDQIYSQLSLLLYMSNPLATDIPVNSFSGSVKSMASTLSALGLSLLGQSFTVYAGNPLTEDISVSGKMTITSEDDEVLDTQEFSHKTVTAQTTGAEILQAQRAEGKMFAGCTLENLVLHLPENYVEKDPAGGWGSFTMGYRYKSYLSLGNDFSFPFGYTIDNVNLPLARYKVKQAKISLEISNEIPITLTVDGVEVLPAGSVEITSGLVMASGTSGNPTVSPLEIVVKAQEGTLPDISAINLSFIIGAPTGAGDKRLNLNQAVTVNKLRATVYGGITL